MTLSDIATVTILSVAVIVSLGIGVASILQTWAIQAKQQRHAEEIQAREHKNRLLDEITNWAIEIAKLSIIQKEVVTAVVSWSSTKVRNRYMKAIASSFKQPSLEKAVNDLVDTIEQGNTQPAEYTYRVIDEAAKIRARDLKVEDEFR